MSKLSQFFKPPASAQVHRLSADDYQMYILEKGGYNIAMQMVCVIDKPVDQKHVELMNKHFASSGLSRVRYRSVLKIAPGFWGRIQEPPPVHVHPTALRPEQVDAWINEQSANVARDSRLPGFSVGTAPLHDGRSVVAITISHHIADGRGAMYEIYSVIGNILQGNEPVLATPEQALPPRQPKIKQLAQDLRLIPYYLWNSSSIITFYTLPVSVLKVLLRLIGRKPQSELTDSVTVFFDSAQATAIAKEHGGSMTTLTSAITTNVMHKINPKAKALSLLRVAVDLRTADNSATTNNATSALVDIKDIPKPIRQLAPLKAVTKKGYERLAESTRETKRTPGLLISNVGRIPTEISQLIPGCTYVYGRAVPALDTALKILAPECLFAANTVFEDKLAFTFSAVKLKPKQKVDLEKLFREEFSSWGLIPVDMY